jgi:peptidoglycan/LPS O-acetylase OafA/YrhL
MGERGISLARLKGFTRITSGRKLIPEIDGLRFAALGFVFLLHLDHQVVPRSQAPLEPSPDTSVFSRLLESGEYGVQLFFAISGFILALPFASSRIEGVPPVSLKRFYVRRLTRLEPPLLINLLVLFAIQTLVSGISAVDRLPHLIASAPYLHNAIFQENSLINPVIWSLEVEAQFYLVTPFLTLIFCLSRAWVRRAVLVAGIVGFAHFGSYFHKAALPAQLEHFLVGFLLADFHLNEWAREPESRHKCLADLAGLLAWISIPCLYYYENLSPLSQILLPFATLVAFTAAFRGRLFRAFFRLPIIVVIGGMCYTFYLYHLTILSVFSRITCPLIPETNYYLFYFYQLLILGPITLIGSAILFRFVERPFMDADWPKRFWGWCFREWRWIRRKF